MNISFYTAAVGAQQQQERLDIHANNIANVNTYGFKARRPTFAALMTGPITGINEDLPRGVGSRVESAEADFRQSAVMETGRALDYAIEGNGFFTVLDPKTGEFAFIRDGSFTTSEFQIAGEPDENGQPTVQTVWYLSDGLGRFVLGRDGRPIEVTDETQELPIGVFDFVNYNGMVSSSENRTYPVEKNGQVGLSDARLIQGYLEMSNADLGYELAKVIESQRSFQYMLRMVQTSDEIETTVNNLR